MTQRISFIIISFVAPLKENRTYMKFEPKTLAILIIISIALGTLNFSCRKPNAIVPVIPDPQSNPPLTSVPNLVKPNIILILADDVGFEVPTCDGGQSYSTPNLDRMAAEGIRFNQCHSAPLCSPSRFELLTGKYNFRNYNLWGVMDTTNRTIANMLKDAGYHTFVAGKWQLDGGNASIHALGFDDYIVHGPYTGTGGDNDEDDGSGSSIYKSSPYKDPDLYYDSKKLTDSERAGKFGDDIYVDSLNRFINNNLNHPFFIYYPMALCHYPFIPTPDNPDFANWNNKRSLPKEAYFPDMIHYMDKKVGEILDSIKAKGLANNTIVIFTCDNGTDGRIVSNFHGQPVKGGKSKTYETGVRVPLIMWAPGNIQAQQINDDLVDFTDFMPTLADMAEIAQPQTYGTLDGISFYPYLKGGVGTKQREWVFCHYKQNQDGEGKHPTVRWVKDKNYKLYDSTGEFYSIKKDVYERNPLSDNELSADQKAIKEKFASILSTMHN